MDRENNLIPLTEEMRRRGSHARTLRKTNAARLNPVKHGRYIQDPKNAEKSILALKLEKELLKEGVPDPEALTKHLLESLAQTERQLQEEFSFQNSGAYTRLVLEVFRTFKETFAMAQAQDGVHQDKESSAAMTRLENKLRDELGVFDPKKFIMEAFVGELVNVSPLEDSMNDGSEGEGQNIEEE